MQNSLNRRTFLRSTMVAAGSAFALHTFPGAEEQSFQSHNTSNNTATETLPLHAIELTVKSTRNETVSIVVGDTEIAMCIGGKMFSFDHAHYSPEGNFYPDDPIINGHTTIRRLLHDISVLPCGTINVPCDKYHFLHLPILSQQKIVHSLEQRTTNIHSDLIRIEDVRSRLRISRFMPITMTVSCDWIFRPSHSTRE